MIEFSDDEWAEIESGPFGEIIEQLSRVHTDLTKAGNEIKQEGGNLFRAAQHFGQAHIVHKAAVTLYETQRNIEGLEKLHEDERHNILENIVEIMTGRVPDNPPEVS